MRSPAPCAMARSAHLCRLSCSTQLIHSFLQVGDNASEFLRGFPSVILLSSEFRNWEIGRSQFFPFALVCAMKECAYLLLTAPVVHPEILNIFLSLDYQKY